MQGQWRQHVAAQTPGGVFVDAAYQLDPATARKLAAALLDAANELDQLARQSNPTLKQ